MEEFLFFPFQLLNLSIELLLLGIRCKSGPLYKGMPLSQFKGCPHTISYSYETDEQDEMCHLEI